MTTGTPFVSVTTDFGAGYTGVCVGVIARIAPEARVVVLSDEVTRFAVVEGAMLLRQALPYLPVGVHLAVVDPGVGTARQPIAVRAGRGDLLVGPDNGLLVPATEVLGGVTEARLLGNPKLRLSDVSHTFHGRDVFAPAAAHLANGVDLAAFGEEVTPVALDLPAPVVSAGELTATVLYIDDFGSPVLAARPADLERALGRLAYGSRVTVGGTAVTWADTYGAVPVGDPLLYADSSGWLALAVNQGSAAARFGVGSGDTVSITGR